jgi:hypothetical protein
MGIPVLIIGESGSGKTYSIKNLDPDKVGIFLCEKNRLPFRKKFITYKVRNMQKEEEGKVTIYRQSASCRHLVFICLGHDQRVKKTHFFLKQTTGIV